MTSKIVKLLSVLFLFLSLPANAYYNPGNPTGLVNDYAGVLSDQAKIQLEEKLSMSEKESGNEIAVATIPSLQGDTIENFAVKLFEQWKIGKKNNDNGVLILIALADRQMRIEVGYGLGGALTDAESFGIIDNEMKPAFQQGDYYKGIDSAIDKIVFAVKGEYAPPVSKTINFLPDLLKYLPLAFYFLFFISARFLSKTKSFWLGSLLGAGAGGVIGFLLQSLIAGLVFSGIFGIIGLLFDYTVSKKGDIGKKGGGMWFGGGSGFGGGGGGFGGFGGGRSGGGGASGRW